MNTEIWVAIITGICTLFGVVVTVIMGNSKTIYRLDVLEKKVDKHNQLQERVALTEQSLNTLHKRIDKLSEKE